MKNIKNPAKRADWQVIITQKAVLTILCLWICIILHCPLYNSGGAEGVGLPWNIVAWAIAVIIIFIIAVLIPSGRLVITQTSGLLFLAIILLTFPVLWCPNFDWIIYSLPRLAGLWGCAVFYFALLQCRFSFATKRLLLWCITLASVIQGGNVIAGLFCPSILSPVNQMFLKTGGRVSLGIFQQVNVTASLIAMGFALSLALFYRMVFLYRKGKNGLPSSHPDKIKYIYLIVTMIFLPCTLVLTQSRTGWLGGIIVYLSAVTTVLLTARRQGGRAQRMWRGDVAAIVFAPAVGIAAGIFLLSGISLPGGAETQALDHSASNFQRWLTFKVTWEMIRLHPWAGWGLGSFIVQFQHYIASHYHPNPSREFMGHPHNEILYVWMEGGIVALAGLVVMGSAVVMLFKKNWTPARRLIAMAMLPVLLHTMLEYPLYLSSPHALLLLLITLNLERAGPQLSIKPSRMKIEFYMRAAAAGICMSLLGSLYNTYQINSLLSHFDAGDMPNALSINRSQVPWLLLSRYDADRMNLMFEQYNQSGDLQLLRDVISENARWLKTHTHPDNYVGQVETLRYLHHEMAACRYLREGNSIFPQDERLKDPACQQ
ncbi:O-antigen ligase family protein [Pantoea sp. Lu_F5_004]|uniref:O-antigen ligase family protein n=1 Tax=Pantoea sp. Lu_F5_004 TaxID=3443507 RepID=UPI003EC0470B